MDTIEYTVDGEVQTTTDHKLTPTQIMRNAGIDAATNYLVEILSDHRQISFNGKPNEEIEMHQKMEFFTNSLEPTPVS